MVASPANPSHGPGAAALSTLRLYFTFSDALRWSFEGPVIRQYIDVLDNPPAGLTIREFVEGTFVKEPESVEEVVTALTHVSYWFAALYVVIEGWKDLGLRDEKIDKLLESPFVETLRRFRNGMFHYQRSYQDARFQDWLFKSTDEAAAWARQVRDAFAHWFKINGIPVNFEV